MKGDYSLGRKKSGRFQLNRSEQKAKTIFFFGKLPENFPLKKTLSKPKIAVLICDPSPTIFVTP